MVLTESLAGRFEVLHLPHWSLGEMQAAFDRSLDQCLFHGGYPWSSYAANAAGKKIGESRFREEIEHVLHRRASPRGPGRPAG